MAEFLTKGGIARIKSGDCSFHPVLQITQIQQLKGAEGAAARYRFHLTDGADKIQSMPATQLNPAILEGKLQQYSIIKIVNFQTSNVNGHIIVILLGYEPVAQLNYEVPSRDSAPQYAAPIAAAPSSLYHPTYGTTTSNPSNAPITPAQPPAHPAYPSHPSTAPSHQPYANVPSYGTTSVPGNAAYPPRAPVAAAPTNPYGSYGSSSSSKPVMKDDAAMSANVVPISAINPYSSKWTIKARITAKSDIRKWSNARGEGTLFSIDLLDSHGGEIRGTFFKDACEKFYPMLQEGKVYTFSGGTLKVVQNKQYSHLKNNYEITFNQNSEIIAVHDDAGIKSQVFNFVKINAIAMTETNATIDIIAVVRAATEVSEIVSTKQGGRTLLKRDLTLIDESGTEIKLTLWGDKASTPYDWSSSPIAAFKNVRVGDYGGKSLSSSASTTITLNPLIPEGEALHKWKVSFGGAVPSGTSLSGGASQGGGLDSFDRRKLIASIRDEGLGLNTEKPDYITIKGTIVYIKHDTEPFYSACPTPGCNKKVTETMNGEFHCEKCNKTFPTCIRRYILSVSMADHSGSNWFTLFNDTADILLKAKAQDLHELKVQGDEAGYEKIFSDALFKTVVGKVRVKQESMNNEEMRVKSSFMKVEEVDFIAESRNLLDAINKYQ